MSFLESFVRTPIEAAALGAAAGGREAVLARASFAAAAAGPVFVDVGASAVEANISRDGITVPSLQLDPAVLAGIIDARPVATRLKVVRQSVEAGRAVERGTVVNLVLAEPNDLPLNIVGGIHSDLAGRTIGDVFDTFVQTQPDVRKILATRSSVTDMTTAERETLAGALAQGNVAVDSTDTAAMTSAFTGLQAANLFGG